MTFSRQITIISTVLLAACLASSVLLLRQVDRLRTSATLEEILYVPSPKILRKLSLGYNGLLADIYWTRAVQYFGNKHHEGADHYALLAPLLEITVALDPHLKPAYDYGSSFLAPKPPAGAGEPQRAIELEKYGIRNNPDDWKLYYQLGFIDYMELRDYEAAARAFESGSRVPHAHPFLKLLAAQMAEHAGDPQTARLMWTTTYQTSTDFAIRANAAAHLRALQVDRDVTNLEGVVQQYRKHNGYLPDNFEEMARAGMLPGIPVDPLGHPYKLHDGHVELSVPDDFPFVQKGLPPGYIPPKAPKILPTD